MKNTKAKLISSVAVLLICFAMLIGSTFAWFTDSASTGVNKIQAGTLDIEIVDGHGDSIDHLDWVKADGAPAGEEVLWEPGATYKLPNFYVKNTGSLALKYKVVISGINGDEKLNEVIDWTITRDNVVLYDSDTGLYTEFELQPNRKDETPITVQGKMKETASNDYQGLTIDGITVTVLARQLNSEYDSLGNNYDENSEYDLTVWDGSIAESLSPSDENSNVYEIYTAAELAKFAQMVNENTSFAGKTVKLMNDLNLSNIGWEPIGTNHSFAGTFDGNNKTISNVYCEDKHYGGLFGRISESVTIQKLNLNNVQLTNGGNFDDGKGEGECAGGALVGWVENHTSDVRITNVTIAGIKADGYKNVGGLVGYQSGANSLIIENVSIVGTQSMNTINSSYNESGSYKGHVGGLIGFYSNGNASDITLKDINITRSGDASSTGHNRAGAVVGTIYSPSTISVSSIENVNLLDERVTQASKLAGPGASSGTVNWSE